MGAMPVDRPDFNQLVIGAPSFRGALRSHEHPNLGTAIENSEGILEGLGWSPEQIRARLDEIGRPFRMSLSVPSHPRSA
jgi:hypothetical protein